ncbi:MAG: 3-deoxy-D-manno-octulosonic acid transferase [Rickettsiales bacterium]|nr:MAG: 3-deoxy-D-manno-octulosonic acid transferase [Rickettsiales bacterium]
MNVIYLYNIINIIISPLYLLLLIIRIIKKKDNITSALQRIGFITRTKPDGNLIWLHAASIGESIAAMTLINALTEKYPNHHFLITTGTLSSAHILKKTLPSNAFHQFLPLDNIISVNIFLNHWKPEIAIFVESELWPCLINAAERKMNLLLVNARLSDATFMRWKNFPYLFKNIINKFDIVITQSKTDFEKYQQLGCHKLINLGSLKFANERLPVNQSDLMSLQNLFKDKKIFVAASTHKEDEKIILMMIDNLKKQNIDYFPIIILRHPERRDEIVEICRKYSLKYSLRSESEIVNLENDLYIVDSFGELGLFFSLAHIVFIGGSFTFRHGGHNLLEPAHFNNIILLGPDMSNWQNITDAMLEYKAAVQVSNVDELTEKMKFFLKTENLKQGELYKQNALNYVNKHQQILDHYLTEISRFL